MIATGSVFSTHCIRTKLNCRKICDSSIGGSEEGKTKYGEKEVEHLVSQNATPSKQRGSLPPVFTEQGVAAVSGVIKRAV